MPRPVSQCIGRRSSLCRGPLKPCRGPHQRILGRVPIYAAALSSHAAARRLPEKQCFCFPPSRGSLLLMPWLLREISFLQVFIPKFHQHFQIVLRTILYQNMMKNLIISSLSLAFSSTCSILPDIHKNKQTKHKPALNERKTK